MSYADAPPDMTTEDSPQWVWLWEPDDPEPPDMTTEDSPKWEWLAPRR